jgi:hypothetical protein
VIRHRDCDWLAEHGLELSARYPGKWVAVYDEQVIGVGETVAEANEQAIQRRPQRDFILEQINVDVDLPPLDVRMDGVRAIVSERCARGEHDVAARHDEHQA